MNAFHPEVQEFMTNLILEVVENYDVDGIQGMIGCQLLPAHQAMMIIQSLDTKQSIMAITHPIALQTTSGYNGELIFYQNMLKIYTQK